MALLTGLATRHFSTIVSDVPWKFIVRSHKGLGRSAERHYDTMTLGEVAALPVARFAADNAHLFFWITGPFFAAGAHLPIMRAWGFEPTAIAFVWIKPTKGTAGLGRDLTGLDFKMGMGHTTRQNAEFVVLGRRGAPQRLSKSIRQVIVEPARQHSRKPECFYSSVEKYAAGPRLELFGRTPRRAWTVRGNEVGKFK